MTPPVVILPGGLARPVLQPWWRWPLDVAAAFVMPWRAVRRIRDQDLALTFMLDAAARRYQREHPEASAPPAPVLRLIRGGDGQG